MSQPFTPQAGASIPEIAAAARAAFAHPATLPDYWIALAGIEIGQLAERVICTLDGKVIIEAERGQHKEVYGQLLRAQALVRAVSFVNLEHALAVAAGAEPTT